MNLPIVLVDTACGTYYNNHRGQFIAVSENIFEAMTFESIEHANKRMELLLNIADWVDTIPYLTQTVKEDTRNLIEGLMPYYVTFHTDGNGFTLDGVIK